MTLKLWFVFSGVMDDEGGGEGVIDDPKVAFKSEAACQRFLDKTAQRRSASGSALSLAAALSGGMLGQRPAPAALAAAGAATGGGRLHSVHCAEIKGAKDSSPPAQVFELTIDGDSCAVFAGLFATRALAEAEAKKMKADEKSEWGREMDTAATISAVEVLEEHSD